MQWLIDTFVTVNM
jgi:hypothetical protein